MLVKVGLAVIGVIITIKPVLSCIYYLHYNAYTITIHKHGTLRGNHYDDLLVCQMILYFSFSILATCTPLPVVEVGKYIISPFRMDFSCTWDLTSRCVWPKPMNIAWGFWLPTHCNIQKSFNRIISFEGMCIPWHISQNLWRDITT